jgi:hypothetical protein
MATLVQRAKGAVQKTGASETVARAKGAVQVLQEATAGGLSIPIAAYHYNHNTGSKL